MFRPLELLVLISACALCAVVLTAVQKWTHWKPAMWLQALSIGLVVSCVMLWIRRRRSSGGHVG
jgi:Flp pilus assembly protein TadB